MRCCGALQLCSILDDSVFVLESLHSQTSKIFLRAATCLRLVSQKISARTAFMFTNSSEHRVKLSISRYHVSPPYSTAQHRVLHAAVHPRTLDPNHQFIQSTSDKWGQVGLASKSHPFMQPTLKRAVSSLVLRKRLGPCRPSTMLCITCITLTYLDNQPMKTQTASARPSSTPTARVCAVKNAWESRNTQPCQNFLLCAY